MLGRSGSTAAEEACVFAMVISTRGRRSGKRGEVAHELAVDGSPRLGQLENYYKKACVEAPCCFVVVTSRGRCDRDVPAHVWGRQGRTAGLVALVKG